jgi:hypothetical protein
MKSYRSFFLGSALTTLVCAAFWAGNAYASTGCFTDTNSNWAETYICWLKDNSISNGYGDGTYGPNNNVTRAEMAVFLKRVADVPPSVGDSAVSQSLASIFPNTNYTSGSVGHYSDAVVLKTSAVTTNFYHFYLNVPTSLYGKAMYLKGVQLCYDATIPGASLSYVELDVWGKSGDFSALLSSVVDSTVRTDHGCREYDLASPFLLSASNQVDMLLLGDFSALSGMIKINSAAALLTPSTSAGSLSLESGEPAATSEPSALSPSGQ